MNTLFRHRSWLSKIVGSLTIFTFMVSMLTPLAYATAQEATPDAVMLVTENTAKEGDKVTLCVNDNNWHTIEVADNAVDAHLNNGAFVVDNEHPCPPEVAGGDNEVVLPPSITIDAQKIVCASEDMLPNWQGGADITADTAADFVADHDGCRIERGWEFEWGPQAAADAGPDFIGHAEGYTTFTGSTDIELTDATAQQINVREVLKDGYIPFTNDNENSVSAELWCGSDVLNYDNLEWITNPVAGTTYHCVAFNVPVKIPAENSCTLPDTEVIDEIQKTPAENDETSLQAFLTDAGYTLDVVADQTGIQRWNTVSDKEVTITTTFIDSYAGNGNVFGYYRNGDLSTFTPIFRKGDVAGYESTPEAQKGDTFSATVPVGAGTLGFAIRNFDGQLAEFTFATESALNIEGIDQVLVYNPNDNEYVFGFEDIDHAAGDEGDFNDLVASVSFDCSDVSDEPQQCEIVSDVTNTVVAEGNPSAVEVVPHANWFSAETLGSFAKWIWSALSVSDSSVDEVQTFKKTFTSEGVTAASLQLAADNGFLVKINGEEVVNKFTEEHNYENLTGPIDVADKIIDGTNTIEITVKNQGLLDSTPVSNPAGLLYKLDLSAESCSTEEQIPTTGSIQITKYSCSADVVPNRTDNGVGKTVPETCAPQADASFGYVHGSQTDALPPHPELSESLIPGGVTGQDGVLTISDLPATGRYLVRETDATNLLGLYCEGDGDTNPTNNDNQEITFVPAGGVTKCVAYNKGTSTPPAQCIPEENAGADAAVATQGLTKNGNTVAAARSDANSALGTPDWVPGTSENFFALGFGGTITLSFDKFVTDESGTDFSIYEATNGNYPLEKAKVEVSQDGTTWVDLGVANNTGDLVSEFDLDGSGLSWIKYVKITDTTDAALFGDGGADGFDVDAVVATLQACTQPEDPQDDGDDNDGGDNDTNHAPIAVASADPSSITLPTASTTLSSAGSMDPDGDVLTYTWTYVSGPVNIDPSDVANPAISGLTIAGTYVFKLTVSDGTLSDEAEVTVIVVGPVQKTSGGSSVVGGRGGNGGGQVLGDFTGPAVLGDNACGEYITSYIKLGSKENDPENVKRLQIFLNEYMGTKLVVDGIYGRASYEALKKFQVKEIPEVLTPWIGITLKGPVGTGWVYKTTRRWINMIKCPELNIPRFEKNQLTF